MSTIFEQATRAKLRYPSTIGSLTTEDLWDLPLETKTNRGTSLDTVAIDVHKQLEETKSSFVTKKKGNVLLELKMEVLKHIIDFKLQEKEDRELAIENKQRKELLMDVIAEKEIDELKEKSVKALKKEIKRL